MNKFPTFLSKYSQKLALLSVLTGFGASYLLQPYYEIFTRWSLFKIDGSVEAKTSERVTYVAKQVLRDFKLDNNQMKQLDVFISVLDQPLVLGSLKSRGYAFIGLPSFVSFADVSEIPLDDLNFHTREFPHGAYSELGKQRLALMVLPESALRFLIARELVRLGASTIENQSFHSARYKCLLTTTAMIASLYAAYQISYVLNRTFALRNRWTPWARFLLYTSTSFFALFCQYQFCLAWRRNSCFTVDRIVANLGESYRQGGLDYYSWRLHHNQYWHARSMERLDRIKDATRFDPVRSYQDEQRELKVKRVETAKEGEPVVVYDVPEYNMCESTEHPNTAATSECKVSFQSSYKANPRVNASGEELWAGDGDFAGFGITDLLASGLIPWPLAGILSMFNSPATSGLRWRRLKQYDEVKP